MNDLLTTVCILTAKSASKTWCFPHYCIQESDSITADKVKLPEHVTFNGHTLPGLQDTTA